MAYKFLLTRTSFTFKEVKQRVDEMAQNLLSLGFKKGDRLAVMLPNIPEINISALAAASIGVIVVLLNPGYQLVEAEYMLKKTGAKGIVILDNFKSLQHYNLLKTISPEIESGTKGELSLKNLPDLKHVFVVKNRLISDKNFQYKGTWDFNEIEKFNRPYKERPHVDFDDSLTILFTVCKHFMQ